MAGSCNLTDDLQLDRQMRHHIEVVVDRLVAANGFAAAAGGSRRAGAATGRREFDRRDPRRSGCPADSEAASDADSDSGADGRRIRGKRKRRTRRAARRRHGPLGPLRLHALRPELRAAPARNCSASTARKECADSATGLGEIYGFDAARLVPDPKLIVQGRLLRVDRPVERNGPLAAAYLSRRGRHARAAHAACRAARCSKRRGTSCPAELQNAVALGHRRRSTSRSPGGTARTATNTAAVRGHHAASCCRAIATSKSRIQRRQLEKYMSVVGCGACGGARLNPQARAVTLTSRAAEIRRSAGAIAAGSLQSVGGRRGRVLQRAWNSTRSGKRSPPKCSRKSAAGSASWSTSASSI